MRHLIHRHIGVRAEGMILAAGIWCLLGAGIWLGLAPDRPGAFHTLLPLWLRVAMWVVPAVLAATVAASERWSPYGLALLTIGPTVHLVSYLWAWLMDLIPGPPPGDSGGWYRAGIYAALLALVILLSHIPASVRAPLSGRHR